MNCANEIGMVSGAGVFNERWTPRGVNSELAIEQGGANDAESGSKRTTAESFRRRTKMRGFLAQRNAN